MSKKSDRAFQATRLERALNYLLDLVATRLVVAIIELIFVFNNFSLKLFGEVILHLLVFFLYYLILEGLFNKTLGKLFTKTRVIGPHGEKPTFKQLLIRSVVRSFPLEPITFLILPVGLHDLISNTKVVSEESN